MIPAVKHDVIVDERKRFIRTKGSHSQEMSCDADSVAGCVSQRACVYCGARVVLNPITDAVHLVHGPIGCASYTWDIRGSLSSGSELYRNSFSTDLGEGDVIFGGEKKLARCIDELVDRYEPAMVIVYSTCIVGLIGDDLQGVCRSASRRHGIKVIPVESSGFAGNKSDGYRAACEVLMNIISSEENIPSRKNGSINYLGDFNLAGEAWIIRNYLEQAGIEVNVVFTGDSNYKALKKARQASLNIVQCAGSMGYLAKRMQAEFDIPYFHVSFLGLEDTATSLRNVTAYLGKVGAMESMEEIIRRELELYEPVVRHYRGLLEGKRAAIYVGGGFKAISLIKQFQEIGIEVVMIGTQTGRPEEYDTINTMINDGTVVLDDANPSELEMFMVEQRADLLVGGVKERPLAHKLGMAFIDHNHGRKHALSGFEGAANFAEEVYATVCSPVWDFIAR